MSAAAHNSKFAKKAGVPQKVAKEFHNADRGKYGHKPKGGGKGRETRDSAGKREKRLEGKEL